MDFLYLILYFLTIIPSSILHEYAHGWMADQLGDPTARLAGRLTLDPRKHIDPLGTIAIPLGLYLVTGGAFMFAYAKPVPYNPYNLKDQKWGPALVGVAGPLSNILLAAAFAVVFRMFPELPVSPFVGIVIYANIMLAIFNLVPLPPLDGSKVLFALMPDSWSEARMYLERYGFVLMMIFALFFFRSLSPLIEHVFTLLTGVSF